jgi:hypothetical protein
MLAASTRSQALIAAECEAGWLPPDEPDDPDVVAAGAEPAGPVPELEPHAAIDVAMATPTAPRMAASQNPRILTSTRRPALAEQGPRAL